MALGSLWSCLLWFCALATATHSEPTNKPFSCTGGVVYFSAHPVDSLLFQNPDLLHDLHVLKCVTTVVLTSGNRGVAGNFSLSLEHGLQQAYAHMAGVPVTDPTQEEKTVRIGTHDVHSWLLRGHPNIQIIYLRLPDDSQPGQGYGAQTGASLAKLYRKEIYRITSTDGLAVYTLRDLRELIGSILHMRKPTDVRMLDHKGDEKHDHPDHIVSAKLVQKVVTGERVRAKVHAYAGNVMRNFEANVNPSHRDYGRKANAFFKYAAHDEYMCQSLSACARRVDNEAHIVSSNDDVRYVAKYLRREYYAQ